jgi:cell shape-determining protein MreD
VLVSLQFVEGLIMDISPSLGEIGCWALIFAGMAYFVAKRFGEPAAFVAAGIAALTVKAALLDLT